MSKALAEPRADLSQYAPRIVTMNINPEKIGDLIGPKGKTIRGIQEETGAEITVDDTGLVTIAAVGGEAMERARQMIQALTAEPVIGETYEGTVKSTTAFGAFVEIMPGTEGLVHISELKHGRTEKTEDVVKKGDRVKVKLLDRDERGRLRLSMKALTAKPEGEEGRGKREEGSGEPQAMAAVGAETEESAREGGEGSERGSSDRGDRPRRSRGGRGGRDGGRSRE
jgi:polyribonucleotide nucleotidyltransferase